MNSAWQKASIPPKSLRPFAVFDIDGTIIRWQLYHAIADALATKGHIDHELFKNVKAARMNWKRRAHESSFTDYEITLVNTYDKALKSLSFDSFMQAAQGVFDEYKDQTYNYTRDLIYSLKDQGYLLFAISASQEEIVEMLAKYYGFDAWAGSTYKRQEDSFTGEKTPLRRELKVKTLKSLAEKFEATYEGSIAVGDSDSDIPMLEIVEQPIAFNPDKKLFHYAQKQGWPIVVERKNIVYKLESQNGQYTLA